MSPSNGKKTPSQSNEKDPRSRRQIVPEAKHLEICKRFKSIKKHTNMPQHYEYKGMRTGKFLANKRQMYKQKDPKHFKTSYWMAEFETIGFPWKVDTTDNKRSGQRDASAPKNGVETPVNEEANGMNKMATDEFMKQYFQLTAFKNAHRHLYVPKNNELASFCHFVRASKAAAILPADQISMLEALGFPWNTFVEGFVHLSNFKNVHGHCNVPRNNEIYSFCQEMRRQMKAKVLDTDHRTALDCINFDWEDKPKVEEKQTARRPQPKLPSRSRAAKSKATCSSNGRRSRNPVEHPDESESSEEEESSNNRPNMRPQPKISSRAAKSKATCSSNGRRSRNTLESSDESECSDEEESSNNQTNMQKSSKKPTSSSSRMQMSSPKRTTRAGRYSCPSKDACEILDDESFKSESSEEEDDVYNTKASHHDNDSSSGDDDDKEEDEDHNKGRNEGGNKDNNNDKDGIEGSTEDEDRGAIKGSIEDEDRGIMKGSSKDEDEVKGKSGIEDQDKDETNYSSPALPVCIENTTASSMDKYDNPGCDNMPLKPSKRHNSVVDTGSDSDVSSEDMNLKLMHPNGSEEKRSRLLTENISLKDMQSKKLQVLRADCEELNIQVTGKKSSRDTYISALTEFYTSSESHTLCK